MRTKTRTFIRTAFTWAALVLALQSGWTHSSYGLSACHQDVLSTLQVLVQGQQSLETKKRLTVTTFNAENLEEKIGSFKYTIKDENGNWVEAKDIHADGVLFQQLPGKGPSKLDQEKLIKKGDTVDRLDSDIVVFQEIEELRQGKKVVQSSVQTCQEFIRVFVKNKYKCVGVAGNDERGINIVMAIKRDLPLEVEVESYKDVKWVDREGGKTAPENLFSRDMPIYHLRPKGQKQGQPLLSVIGNHLKSKRERPRDPQSNRMRGKQMEYVAKKIAELRDKYGPSLRLISCGDLNTSIDEFKSLLENSGVREARDVRRAHEIELVNRNEKLNTEEKKAKIAKITERFSDANFITHSYHPKGGRADYKEMDAIHVSEGLAPNVTDVHVYQYNNLNGGKDLPQPKTYAERSQQASDHRPKTVELDFQPMLEQYLEEQRSMTSPPTGSTGRGASNK